MEKNEENFTWRNKGTCDIEEPSHSILYTKDKKKKTKTNRVRETRNNTKDVYMRNSDFGFVTRSPKIPQGINFRKKIRSVFEILSSIEILFS